MKNKRKMVPPHSRWKCTNTCFGMDEVCFTPTIIPRGYNIEIYREIDKVGFKAHEFVFVFLYDNKYPSAWHVVLPYEQVVACFRPMTPEDKDVSLSPPVTDLFSPEEIRGFTERWEKYLHIKEENEEEAIAYLEQDDDLGKEDE